VTEQELGRKIAQKLDAGLDDIPARQRYRLGLARTAALARARDVVQPLGAAPGGTLVAGFGRRFAAPAIALVLLVLGMVYWQQVQHNRPASADNAEIDSDLLTDELPVTAYLDQGFEIWLYHDTPASPKP
jgi:hypothetical protein